MEVHIPKIDLTQAPKATRVLPDPILHRTLIETVGGDAVRITRNTLGYCWVQVLPAKVITPGAALFVLTHTLKGAVTIKGDSIHWGGLTSVYQHTPVEDFPATPVVNGPSVYLPDFQVALDRTLSAAAKSGKYSNRNPALENLLLTFRGANTEVIGCDGFRLAIYTLSKAPSTDLPDILVDAATLKKLLPKKLGKGVTVSLAADSSNSWASFTVENTTVYLPISKDAYPGVHRLKPIDPPACFSLDAEALRGIISKVNQCMKTGRVKFTGEGVQFTDVGEVGATAHIDRTDLTPCETWGQQIHFRTASLLEALPPNGQVTFRFMGPLSPCVLEGENPDDYQLIMPLEF